MEFLKLLHRYGAQFDKANNLGRTPLHTAAANEKPFAIIFLQEVGVDMDPKCKRGQTPLHQACYHGAEDGMYYLQPWTQAVNWQDEDGNTPLHLAVEQIVYNCKLRPIKDLLILGADRTVKNANGETPLDVIPKEANEETRDELVRILKKQPLYIPCCTLRLPLKKITKNNLTSGTYVFLVVVTFAQLNLLVFPHPQFEEQAGLIQLLFLLVNLCFLTASLKDPGQVVKPKGLKFSKLIENRDPKTLCPFCEVSYTEDSRHCFICNKCVHNFDHHCPWINNCVGRDNHVVFYAYITSLLVYFIMLNTMCLSALVDWDHTFHDDLKGSSGEPGDLFWVKFTLIEVTMIATFFTFPLLSLTIIQTQNLLRNTTTYQRFSKKRALVKDDRDDELGMTQSFVEGLLSEQLQEKEEIRIYNRYFNIFDSTDQNHSRS